MRASLADLCNTYAPKLARKRYSSSQDLRPDGALEHHGYSSSSRYMWMSEPSVGAPMALPRAGLFALELPDGSRDLTVRQVVRARLVDAVAALQQ